MKGPTLKYKPYLSCKGCDLLYDIRKSENFKFFSRPKYYCYALNKPPLKGHPFVTYADNLPQLIGYISTYPVTPKWCPLKKKNMLKKLINSKGG